MGRWSSSPVAPTLPSRSALSADSREVNCAAAAATITQPNESQNGEAEAILWSARRRWMLPNARSCRTSQFGTGTVEVAAPTRLGTRWEPAALYRAFGRFALLPPERVHLRKRGVPP